MTKIRFDSAAACRRGSKAILIVGIVAIAACVPLAARQGDHPPAAKVLPQNNSASAEAHDATLAPPTQPIEEIIQKFAAREAEFKTERDNFTYTQTFSIQTLDSSDRVDGEYKMTSEIVFTPSGKRFEKVTYAPPPTLERISLSQQDLDDLEHVQPFVLTTAELPKYNVKYVDREPLDELNTYVFEVGPKPWKRISDIFRGVSGWTTKILPSSRPMARPFRIFEEGPGERFPAFETFRENIEGHYWFPTYTRSNDMLHFQQRRRKNSHGRAL